MVQLFPMLSSSNIDSSDWIDDLSSFKSNNNKLPISSIIKNFLYESFQPVHETPIENFSYFAENSTGSGLIYPLTTQKRHQILNNKLQNIDAEKLESNFLNKQKLENQEDESWKPLIQVDNKPNTQNNHLNSTDSYSVLNNENKVSITFLLVQGIYAGFSFVILFASQITNVNQLDASFIESYSHRSSNIRRYMYLLSTISLIGSLDRVLSSLALDPTAKSDHRNRLVIFSVIASFLHLISFLSTTIMSKVDTLLSLNYGFAYDSKISWAEKAVKDSKFV